MFGSNSKRKLGFIRSKSLGLFAIFKVNKNDACDILACLEHADPKYNDTIEIPIFAQIFCPSNQYLFQYLWESYQTSLGRQVDTPSYYCPTYIEFLSFLLFFMSISGKDMIKYSYFVWYYLPRILPLQFETDKATKIKLKITTELLEEIMAKLIGPGTKQAIQLNYYKGKLVKAIRDEPIEHLTFNQFNSYNAMVGLVYSQSLIKLQNELKATMIGKSVWYRLHYSFNEFMKHPQQSLQELDDTEYMFYIDNHQATPATSKSRKNHSESNEKNPHAPKPEKYLKTVYRSFGERTQARVEIGPFLSFLKNYMEMPLNGFMQKKKSVRRRNDSALDGSDDEEDDNDADKQPDQYSDDGKDEEDDDSDEELVGPVGHRASIIWQRLFGARDVKIAPMFDSNPVIAKYSSLLLPAAAAVPDHSSLAAANSNKLGSLAVPDIDGLVDCVLTKNASEDKQFSGVMDEPIDELKNRIRRTNLAAVRILSDVREDLSTHVDAGGFGWLSSNSSSKR